MTTYTTGVKNLGDYLGGLIGANSTTKPHSDNKSAMAGLEQDQNAFAGARAPHLGTISPALAAQREAAATRQGPSAFNGIAVNPAYNEAQVAQMAALRNLAANGGRSAATDASRAQIEQSENANAKAGHDAVMQGMARRGMSSSGNSMLAQLSASQAATNAQAARDQGVLATEADTALKAGQGAAAIGSSLQGQAYGEQAQRAAASDAIDRFNAGAATQASEFNAGQGNQMSEWNAGQDTAGQIANNGVAQSEFGDDMAIRAGKQGGGKDAAEYWSKKYKEDQAANGGMMGGMMKGVGAVAAAAAHGGQVPGTGRVRGDSYANDTVPVLTSPKEVIVPRSLAQSGSRAEIADFVQHPPAIKDERALKLAALKSLASRK